MRHIRPTRVSGTVKAPPSKSLMQRSLLAASLARGTSRITNPSLCDDALAAADVARALGADVVISEDMVRVTGGGSPVESTLDCGESGLCMRATAAIASLFTRSFTLVGRGSLASRPMGMIPEPLEALGASCVTTGGRPPLTICGPLKGGRARVDGAETSQFLTGLLMALPLCGRDSQIEVERPTSTPYIAITLEVLSRFGIEIGGNGKMERFAIRGRQAYRPTDIQLEGDFSGAAFLLVAGAVAGSVRVEGLRPDSQQADRAILKALEAAGAKPRVGDSAVAVEKANLKGFEFDASHCPDLLPPLAALACHCRGVSTLLGAARLRHKESDRAAALVSEMTRMGAAIQVKGNALVIEGGRLRGGQVSSHGDHRIAMACAVAALASEAGVSLEGEECVAKSYPSFFRDLESLGVGA